MTDIELIQLCKNKNPKGQELLYRQYHSGMTRLCLRYLQNEPDTFEALTSGFLKVFKKIRDFEYQGEGSLEAWIRKIMVNESLMKLRKRKKFYLNVELQKANTESLNAHLDVDAEYLYDTIRRLPDGYRTVFNLHVIEGYSHKEIAEKLGIAESSSRSQLAHAKKKLRELLSSHF